MKKFYFLGLCVLLLQGGFAQKPIKTLIVDGQNNHNMWPKISFQMKNYLEQTGRFKVDVARTAYTWEGDAYLETYKFEGMPTTTAFKKPKADSSFAPDFAKYDLVISNFGWNAAPWPDKTQEAFEAFIKNGGGLVVVHAANNSFPQWPAFNKMIGLGGWGNRTEKDGPYVYFNDKGQLQRDMTAGPGGSHGPQREFVVETRKAKHPIMKGIPAKWLHTKDELYDRLRGPAENIEVLATSYAGKEDKGSGRHEPVLMIVKYGKGRIFHTILGHADYSVQCVGFITTLQRGSQWAAGRKVTIPVPADFPTETKISARPE